MRDIIRKMVTVTLVMALISMFVPAVGLTANAASNSTVKKAYQKKAKSLAKQSWGSISYVICSVSGVKTPVLIISERTTSTNKSMTFYTYKSGKVKKIGGAEGSGGFVKKYKNYFMVSYGHNGDVYGGAKILKYTGSKTKCMANKETYSGTGKNMAVTMEKRACKKAGMKWSKFKKVKKWKSL